MVFLALSGLPSMTLVPFAAVNGRKGVKRKVGMIKLNVKKHIEDAILRQRGRMGR